MTDKAKAGGTIANWMATGITVVLVLLCLVVISNVLKQWTYIPIKTYAAIGLGLILVLAYLIYPAKKSATRYKVPWYDIVLILFGICGTGYIVFFRESWEHSVFMGMSTTTEVVLCLLLILSILEATRRTVGITMSLIATVLAGLVIFYAPHGLQRLTAMMYFGTQGMIGTPVIITFTVILVFLLFGTLIQKSPCGKFMVDTSLALTGRWSGGPAKAAILASGAVGTISGLGPANVAITGPMTIPLMKEAGYKPEFAGAVEAVASNGGHILPPVMGIAAFIMAELLGITYWAVCIAAFIPALLYYLGVFMQVHFEAGKLKLRGLSREQLPHLVSVIKRGWFYLLPLLLLVYLLAVINLPAQHAGMYAAFSVIAIVLLDWQSSKETRKGPKEIIAWLADSMRETGRQLAMPAIACAAAGIIIATVSVSGIGFKLAVILTNLAGGNAFLLLVMIALVSFVMGMGLPGIVTYLVLASLVAPAVIDLGIQPIAAHLFIFYWGLTSLITPPVAISAFIAAGIAGASPMRTAVWAVRLGIMTFILPFIFVYNSSLLLIGSPVEIVVTTVTAVIGVVFLAAGIEGFLLKRLTWLEIALFILGAGLLLAPGWETDIAGVVIIVPTLLWHIRVTRSSASKVLL